MSLLIEACPGHVHIFQQGKGKAGVGFYHLDPEIKVSSGKCLITDLPLNYQEIAQPTVTLDDYRVIYSFGSAWSEASINGLLLLGDNSEGGAAVTDLQSWYDANRLSVRKGPITVSLGNRGSEAFVTGLTIGSADAQFNKQLFTIMLLVAKD